MLLIALFAVLLGQATLWWRTHSARLRISDHHDAMGQAYMRKAATYPPGHPSREKFIEAAMPHLEPAWRYKYAADHPWQAIPSVGAVTIPHRVEEIESARRKPWWRFWK